MITAETAKLVRLLSPTEQRILALIARAMSNAQIAERTHTSESTVKKHREHLREKLELKGSGPDALLLYAVARREMLAQLFPENE